MSSQDEDLLLEAESALNSPKSYTEDQFCHALHHPHAVQVPEPPEEASWNAGGTGSSPATFKGGDALARIVLLHQKKQQVDHEKRIEAILMQHQSVLQTMLQDVSIERTNANSNKQISESLRTSAQAGARECDRMSVPDQNPSRKERNKLSQQSMQSEYGVQRWETEWRTNVTVFETSEMEESDGFEEARQRAKLRKKEFQTVGGAAGTFDAQLDQLDMLRDQQKNGTNVFTGKQHGRKSVFSRSRTTTTMSQASRVRQMADTIVYDRRFEVLVCTFIFFNSLMIGLEADHEIRHPTEGDSPFFRAVNIIFMIAFTVEWGLRITVEQKHYFSRENPKIGWNVFDTALVVAAYVEEVVQLLLSIGPGLNVIRILRAMRIVRGFRIVRVFAFFRDLRIMIMGIMHSLQSLVWALLLLFCVVFLFSVFVLQFAIEENTAQAENDTDYIVLSNTDFDDMMLYFGSLPKTIYTLYCSIVGGIDWADAAKPLLSLNTPLALLFCFYIAFAVLCVLNIVTGVFVESANRTFAEDSEMVMWEQVELRKQWMEEVRELFEAADKDGSGQLDCDEFTKQLQDFRMQAWFRKVGVQVESYSAQGLFALLDFDNDGKLDLDEFAVALQQVNGYARSIDLARVQREASLLRQELGELHAICSDFFERAWNSWKCGPNPARRVAARKAGTQDLYQDELDLGGARTEPIMKTGH